MNIGMQVGPFNVEDGEFIKKGVEKSATAVFSDRTF